jgi:hypothetical protein
MNYCRESFAELFRWISGHSFHRYHNSITRPQEFPDPTWRACGIHIEETSHLFAECPALAQLRYNTLGLHIQPENYNWTPNKLQEMIRAISIKYPEETPYPRQFNTSQSNFCKLSPGLIVRGLLNGLTIPWNLPSQIVEVFGAVLKRRRRRSRPSRAKLGLKDWAIFLCLPH